MVVEPVCPAKTVDEAVALGAEMVNRGIICHVSLQRKFPASFANAPYFYCFNPAFRAMKTDRHLSASNIQALGGRLLALIEVKDRPFLSGDQEVVYPHCFVGREAVKIMVENSAFPVSNSMEAVDLGSSLVAKGFVSYGVSPLGVPNLPFKDEDVFYSFSPKLVPLLEHEVGMSGVAANDLSSDDIKALSPAAAFSRPNEQDEAEGSQFINETANPEDSFEAPPQATPAHGASDDDWEHLGSFRRRVAALEQELSHKQTLLESTTRELTAANAKLAECQAQLRARDELMSQRREDALFVATKLQEQNERLVQFAKEVHDSWR